MCIYRLRKQTCNKENGFSEGLERVIIQLRYGIYVLSKHTITFGNALLLFFFIFYFLFALNYCIHETHIKKLERTPLFAKREFQPPC